MSTFDGRSIILSLGAHGVLMGLLALGIYAGKVSVPVPVTVTEVPISVVGYAPQSSGYARSALPPPLGVESSGRVPPSLKGANTPQSLGSAQGSAAKGWGTEAAVASQKAEYLHKLRTTIEGRRLYPAMARSLKQQGTATVRFVVAKDGTVSGIKLVGSSNHSSLDRAAQDLILNLGRLDPLPPGFAEEATEEGLIVTVPINYVLTSIDDDSR